VLTSSHQPSPNSPTYRRETECVPFLLQKGTCATSAEELCASTVLRQRTTDRSRDSNLSTMSKVLKRVVLTRLRSHPLSEFQSAYRKGRDSSTKCSQRRLTTSRSTVSVMISVQLCTCLRRSTQSTIRSRSSACSREFGVPRMPLAWLHSYLTGQTQFVTMGPHVTCRLASLSALSLELCCSSPTALLSLTS